MSDVPVHYEFGTPFNKVLETAWALDWPKDQVVVAAWNVGYRITVEFLDMYYEGRQAQVLMTGSK